MDKTITRDQVDAVVDALSMFGVDVDTDSFKSDYSGRFMYDKTCIGFVIDGKKEMALGAALAIGLEDTDLVERLLNSSRSDSMGRSDAIFYFPGWTLSDQNEQEQEQDQDEQDQDEPEGSDDDPGTAKM